MRISDWKCREHHLSNILDLVQPNLPTPDISSEQSVDFVLIYEYINTLKCLKCFLLDSYMADETITIPLIRTKLQRPPVVGDHVHRSQLLERLDLRRRRPLTLVAAPAGYGKSTLISCWLKTCDHPAAWLSLDETDNDLHLFLSYMLAAIQTVSPVAGKEIQTVLNGPELPPLSILTGTLINEIDKIE